MYKDNYVPFFAYIEFWKTNNPTGFDVIIVDVQI